MASQDSQCEIKVNSARPSKTRRKTQTPRLPGMEAYSFKPVSCRYSKYVSLSASRVTPRQIRAIIFLALACKYAERFWQETLIMASSAALLWLPHERGARAYVNKTPPFPEAF